MDVNNIGLTLLAYFHNIATIEMLSMASEHIPYMFYLGTSLRRFQHTSNVLTMPI